jgi:hypothetical protein
MEDRAQKQSAAEAAALLEITPHRFRRLTNNRSAFPPTRWRGSMMENTSSSTLSRDDRLTYWRWMQSIPVFYALAACILGFVVISTGSHKNQLDTNSARTTSPGITGTAETVRAAGLAP